MGLALLVMGVPPTDPKFDHFSIKTYAFLGIPPYTILCDTGTAAKLDKAQNRMIWECSGQVRLLLCGTSNDKPFQTIPIEAEINILYRVARVR